MAEIALQTSRQGSQARAAFMPDMKLVDGGCFLFQASHIHTYIENTYLYIDIYREASAVCRNVGM